MTISRNLSILAENVNTSGQVSLTTGVSGALPIANGGTGQTTRQDAIDALAGAVTSGSYLRGDGTDVVMSTIQVADVPTLNQNTTGTAGNVTGIVAIANGGTNSTATPTAGGVGYGTGSAHAYTTAGTSGQALLSGGAGAPTWGDVAAFASGTIMLFAQTAAPTGWTKNTATGDNSALRLVTGAVGSGGSVAFTTAFASQAVAGTVSTTNTAQTATNQSYTPAGSVSVTSVAGTAGATTLSTPQIPSHTHGVQTYQGPGGTNGVSSSFTNGGAGVYQTQGAGGGGSHTHPFSFSSGSGSFTGTAATITQDSHNHTASSSFTGTAINLAVQYIDIIRATKD
jgi:hypothetical protein